MKTQRVSREEEGQRLLRYLSRLMPQAPASFFHRMLRKKNITLNGRRADGSEKLSAGDEVTLFLSDETVAKFAAAAPEKTLHAGPLSVLYEDEDILLADKPAGLLTQRAKEGDDSLNDRLLSYLMNTGAYGGAGSGLFTPSVANRLDRNTSGIVACGKTVAGLQRLSEVFRDRTGEKIYLAAAAGTGVPEGTFAAWMAKDEAANKTSVLEHPAEGARPVRTGIRVLAESADATLLELTLYTGRSHQLRAHLAHLGHPLLGDGLYGGARPGVRRQMLHAWRLALPASDGNVLRVQAPVPEDMRKIIEKGEWTWRPGTAGDFSDPTWRK